MAIVKNIRFGMKKVPMAEYEKTPDWVPLNGEQCYISDLEDYEIAWKVGDGKTKFLDLPLAYKYKKDRIVFTNQVISLDKDTNTFTYVVDIPYNPKYAVIDIKQLKDFNTGNDLDSATIINDSVSISTKYNETSKAGIIEIKLNAVGIINTIIPIAALEVTVVPA